MNNLASDDDSSKQKSIGGLNFRHIVQLLEQEGLEEEANLKLVDEEPVDSELQVYTISNRINRFFKKLALRIFLVAFILDFLGYLGGRLRVVFILASVVAEVLAIQLEIFKKFVIRKMFWGRGSLSKFAAQAIGVFFLAVLLVSRGYTTAIIDPVEPVFSASEPITSTYENDTLVQNASTKTQITRNAARIQTDIYVVKSGDTLSGISSRFGLQIETILWANNMTETDLLRPGMELKIPPGDGVLVTVKKGDTVQALANKYKTNEQLIIEANFLKPPEYTIASGQKLFLPDGVLPESQRPKPVVQAPIYSGLVSAPPASGGSGVVSGKGRFLSWPVAGGQLTQCYSGWHNGLDIADKNYPSVLAAATGTVTFAGCQSGNCPPPGQETGGWGLAWTVVVDHGNGFSTVYGHLNRIYVSSGQKVAAGQALGQMGRSGLAYGVHVHFMLVYTGTWSAVNPAPYMKTSVCGY